MPFFYLSGTAQLEQLQSGDTVGCFSSHKAQAALPPFLARIDPPGG